MVSLEEIAAPVANAIADGPFGSNLKLSDYVAEGVPVLQGKNISNDVLRWFDIRFISEEKAVALERSRVRIGDILLVKIGSIGYSAVVDSLGGFDSAIIPANLAKISPDTSLVERNYLHRWLTSPAAKRYLVSAASRTAQPALSLSKIRQLPVPLPPLDEQRRITAVLDRADALRATRGAAIRSHQTLNQSIFADMFGDPIENPRGFPIRPLMDLVDKDRPVTYGILKPGPEVVEGVPYVRVIDMEDGGIAIAGLRRTSRDIDGQYKRSRLRAGDVLLSIRGRVGRVAVVPDELSGANITQDTARLAATGSAAPSYLAECLRSEALQRWMARHTKGVAVRGINLADVRAMPIPIPPRAEQEEFVATVQRVTSTKRRYLESKGCLNSLFKALQEGAFASEL